MSDGNGRFVDRDAAGGGEEGSQAAESGRAAGERDASGQPDTAAGDVERLKEQLLRTAADFDNFRKRARRDTEDAEKRGREQALREILPVIDNLERAVAAADSAADVKAVVEGVSMVLRLFEDVAGRLGLERVSSVGERFDPNIHDAVQQQETDAHPPGTVISEVVPGYKMGERLIRPAMVVVARPRTSGGG